MLKKKYAKPRKGIGIITIINLWDSFTTKQYIYLGYVFVGTNKPPYKMKKILVLFSAFMAFTSCDKLDDLTKFDMEFDTSVVIESAVNVNLPFSVQSPDVETNSESEFEINDTRKDLIEDIRLKELKLIITTPDDGDFTFLESLEVFISAEGLEDVKIASITDVPDTVDNTIDLETFDVDIKDYIKKDTFSLKLETVTDKVITEDHHIDVETVFFVDAKILGI